MRWFRKKRKVPISSLHINRDIHTHLLPGLDDGRFTFESAADTLVKMYENGISQVCLTPHVIAGLYENTTERLHSAFKGIRDCVGRSMIPGLSLGAEYMIDDTLLSHIETCGADMLTVLGNHVLIEMSYYGMSPQIFDVVSALTQRGYTPVLAHPERYLYMGERVGEFDKLHDAGCNFQLNLLSTTGIYGETSTRIMTYLLERSYYRHVGSDVHSPEQFDRIYGSQMDEKIALAGERASLWSVTCPDIIE